MNQKLTWLHLSDIHFAPSTEWRDSQSRTTLLSHLSSLFEEKPNLRPSLVFCTGDIAFGESKQAPLKEQYAQAKSFFNHLLEVCGSNGKSMPREHLFVVPGNHDVNRNNINADAQATLHAWAKEPSKHSEEINRRIELRSAEFLSAMKRLDEYGSFVAEYLPHQHDDSGRHCYVKSLNIDNLPISVTGFNSAWSCSGTEDDRNLWLGAHWQFNASARFREPKQIRIALIHHPQDWFNEIDHRICAQRHSSDFHFWLHGHTHSQWVNAGQDAITISAGAVGTNQNDEFGINITTIDLGNGRGVTNLYTNRNTNPGWVIAPVKIQAPEGEWSFSLPSSLSTAETGSKADVRLDPEAPAIVVQNAKDALVARLLKDRLDSALRAFSSHPPVLVSRILSTASEPTAKNEPGEFVKVETLLTSPESTIIFAPAQYGSTCLARFMAQEAWLTRAGDLWIYLDARSIKPHLASIDEAVAAELRTLGCSPTDITCVILDSWEPSEKDHQKLLKDLCKRFDSLPIVCMGLMDAGSPPVTLRDPPRPFQPLYLWGLPRSSVREMVSVYNDARPIGDEDIVTGKIISDLDVLNLHRTPLNCLTLLKVSEVDFDESPVNRSEMLKRVLFLLFNFESIPTYRSRPDLKDCEFVIGYFVETLFRENVYEFTRERFLNVLKRCCDEMLIELETTIVFEILEANHILVQRGSFFTFKFSYWILYFAAQRMHHDAQFAAFMLEDIRYSAFPELMEFYTGIDRRRSDALKILIADVRALRIDLNKKLGFPVGRKSIYGMAKWKATPEAQEAMRLEILSGVKNSNLPAAIKDKYADQRYDPTRPYNQTIEHNLSEFSYRKTVSAMIAAARALRNSDFVEPNIKRELLNEIMECWEEVSKVLLYVLPTLAENRYATFDGSGFRLDGHFGDDTMQRFLRILTVIPINVVHWFQDSLFSQKMGPLLNDYLKADAGPEMARHELVLLLINKRPKGWQSRVERYIERAEKNSFFLLDVYTTLSTEYKYGFVNQSTLKDIERLILTAATKHVTGSRLPGPKEISKTKFIEPVVPVRGDDIDAP